MLRTVLFNRSIVVSRFFFFYLAARGERVVKSPRNKPWNADSVTYPHLHLFQRLERAFVVLGAGEVPMRVWMRG